jgi:uncharacterized protein
MRKRTDGNIQHPRPGPTTKSLERTSGSLLLVWHLFRFEWVIFEDSCAARLAPSPRGPYNRSVFLATATSLEPLAPSNVDGIVKIFEFVLLGMVPIGLFFYLRTLRQVDRNGPKTRPDLFTLPDVLVVGVVFCLMLPFVVTRFGDLASALAHPPAAPASPAVPGAPGPEHKAPAKPKPPIDTPHIIGGMLQAALPALGLVAVVMIRGARPSDLFGLGKVPFFRAAGLGLVFALLAYPMTAVLGSVVQKLFTGGEPPQQLMQTFHSAAGGGDAGLIAAIAISAVIVAPISEEIMFRGCFYPVGSLGFGRFPSAFLFAVVFAIIHDSFTVFPSLVLLALCFTIAYEATGSLLVPIFSHAAFNAINLLVAWWMIHLGVNR